MKNEQKKAQRKEAILDAFEALIKKYSIDKTTMQDIATEVGISVGTLYNEFTNKEALIDALVDRAGRSFADRIVATKFRSSTPDEQLLELIQIMEESVESIIKENRSPADYVLSGTQSFRYLGKKINQDTTQGVAATDRCKSIIEEGIAAGVFAPHNAEASARAIMQAFSTYSISSLSVGKDSNVGKDRWGLCFKLMIQGLKVR